MLNETPMSSKGVATAPVDGTGREIRGVRTRVNTKYYETL